MLAVGIVTTNLESPKPMPLAYVMIGTNDLAKARIFYDAIMPEIGGELDADYPGYAFCYKMRGGGRVWIAPPFDKASATVGNGMMVGFQAPSREGVHAAHAAALAHGGTNEGDAGPRPQYGPDFYGAYVRDPDGNKLSFVFLPT
jgi:catechol 2,3-dioxygenase-like lactoylglutathione lyase family enzyme